MTLFDQYIPPIGNTTLIAHAAASVIRVLDRHGCEFHLHTKAWAMNTSTDRVTLGHRNTTYHRGCNQRTGL
jgi:hypothetical protein